jgi:formate hydrogenlyase subunit 4
MNLRHLLSEAFSLDTVVASIVMGIVLWALVMPEPCGRCSEPVEVSDG